MAVRFSGGNSGSRGKDFSPPVPSSGSAQPVLRTETSGAVPASIKLESEGQRQHRHGQDATPDFMPTGGTIPTGSSDIAQQDIDKSYTGGTMNKDGAFNADQR